MRLMIVDDEKYVRADTVAMVKTFLSDCEVVDFGECSVAMDYIRELGADIALLDVNMGVMDGPTLARKLKNIDPNMKVIFVTGYREHRDNDVLTSWYLTKPVSQEALVSQIEKVNHNWVSPSGICAVTFGSFMLYVDGKPLSDMSEKAREILAYLIDKKGEKVKDTELKDAIFGGDSKAQKLALGQLSDTLKKAGASGILDKGLFSFKVKTDAFSCDMYEWFEGYPNAINSFMGEYMKGYSWGEDTLRIIRSGD